jgi:hypothetical protein
MRGVPLMLTAGSAVLGIGAVMAGAPPYLLLTGASAALAVSAFTVMAAGQNKHRIGRAQTGIDRAHAEIDKTQAEVDKVLLAVCKLPAYAKVTGILDEIRSREEQPLDLDKDVRAVPVKLGDIDALAGVEDDAPVASVTVLRTAMDRARGDWVAS